MIYRHAHETAPPLHEVCPRRAERGRNHRHAIAGEKDPADRYPTAAEVIAAIQAYRDSIWGRSRDAPTHPTAGLARTKRSHRLRNAAMVGGVAVAPC